MQPTCAGVARWPFKQMTPATLLPCRRPDSTSSSVVFPAPAAVKTRSWRCNDSSVCQQMCQQMVALNRRCMAMTSTARIKRLPADLRAPGWLSCRRRRGPGRRARPTRQTRRPAPASACRAAPADGHTGAKSKSGNVSLDLSMSKRHACAAEGRVAYSDINLQLGLRLMDQCNETQVHSRHSGRTSE